MGALEDDVRYFLPLKDYHYLSGVEARIFKNGDVVHRLFMEDTETLQQFRERVANARGSK